MTYSEDLRVRAVTQYQKKQGTRLDIATRFEIGVATLSRWIKLFREDGSVQAKPARGGRKATITPARLERLRCLVEAHSDCTLAELAQLAEREFGVPVSLGIVFRALKEAAITRKKNANSL